MRMEALRLFEENERLRKALEKIEYASRKDSLTEHERLQSVRTVVCAALSSAPRVPGLLSNREAEIERLRKASASLLTIVDDLDQYQKRPERGDFGVECACCMGELFDASDREKIEAARIARAT
jgi:hypothetical protein